MACSGNRILRGFLPIGMFAAAWHILAALLSMGTSASAQTPQLTTIDDTVFRADGRPFSGIAIIDWRGFLSADFSSIVANSRTVNIVNGILHVSLVPTTNAPAGAYYQVKYNSSGRVQFTEYWAVSPSATPLRLRDVRLNGPPSAGAIASAPGDTTVTIPDVVGLTEELAARPKRGIGFTASRAAVINESGDIDGAVGDPADCVHVDGSAGPCGSGSTGQAYTDNETPSGTINGSNLTFALANAPSPASSLIVYRNGLVQTLGLDYTTSNATITFGPASTPQPGDTLRASYRLGASGGSGGGSGGFSGAAAGGALAGTYPSPTIAPGVIFNTHISSQAGITESKLALNFATHSNANDPTAAQKAALAGTSGTPSGTNRYVTDQDSRLAGQLGAHAFLSATHTDTAPGTAVRGDIIVSQTSGIWAKLALGAANRCLISNGTDAVWNACLFTGFPSGVIPFVDAQGVLTQNSAKLFWDNTNTRLGVGTNLPAGTLTVLDSTSGTGVTSMIVRAGQGQSTTPLQRWQDYALGTDLAKVNADGSVNAPSFITTSTSTRAGWRDTGAGSDPSTAASGDHWYNTAGEVRKSMESSQTHTLPQVICSAAGTGTSATTSTQLGSCQVPAAMVQAGDRFDIRFDYSHTGTATAFTFEVKWGTVSLLSRGAAAADTAASGRIDVNPAGTTIYVNSQSWGSTLAMAASAGSAGVTPAAVTIGLFGQMAGSTSDVVTLRAFSVVRYPAQTNP